MASGRAGRARCLGADRGGAGAGGGVDPRQGAHPDARACRRDRAHDQPRPRRLRGRGRGERRRRGAVAALRPDLVGRDRHCAVARGAGRRRAGARRSRGRAERGRGPRGRASRHADHRPHARRPRGADDLRPQAHRLGLPARTRSQAARAGGGRTTGRKAVGCRRHVRVDDARGRATRLRGARARAGAVLHADPPARPPRRARLRARAPRLVARALRARGQAPRPHRGA